MHVLSVYEVRSGLVIAQRNVREKENEISAGKDLLTPLYVKDRVWTADAMHTQKAVCQRIEQCGGKYLSFFKDNHPTAHADLALFFEDPQADQSTWGVFSQTEKGHGRLTTRLVRTTTEMNEWFAGEWAGVSQTFQLTRTVTRRQRKLLDVDENREQTPPGNAKKQKKQKSSGDPSEPAKPAKQATSSKKTKKQVIYVKETSQQVVYGLTNLTPTEAGPEAVAAFARAH